MVKNIIIAFLVFITLAFTQAEKYYVTFVKGNVQLERTKKNVKVGDVLTANDKLIFTDKAAKVSCISPGKGRFDINAQAIKAGAKGELLAVLKSSLVPASGTYHLSTRSLMFEGHDPATYFTSVETQGRILLIKDEPLAIKPSYKLDAKNFFFIQYIADGKTVVRKVQHDNGSIQFSDKLFVTDSGTLIGKADLCYQSNASGTARSTIIASFMPIMASKSEIQEQINLIADHLDKTDKKKLKTEITRHLFDNYGKIAAEELTRLFGL